MCMCILILFHRIHYYCKNEKKVYLPGDLLLWQNKVKMKQQQKRQHRKSSSRRTHKQRKRKTRKSFWTFQIVKIYYIFLALSSCLFVYIIYLPVYIIIVVVVTLQQRTYILYDTTSIFITIYMLLLFKSNCLPTGPSYWLYLCHIRLVGEQGVCVEHVCGRK